MISCPRKPISSLALPLAKPLPSEAHPQPGQTCCNWRRVPQLPLKPPEGPRASHLQPGGVKSNLQPTSPPDTPGLGSQWPPQQS